MGGEAHPHSARHSVRHRSSGACPRSCKRTPPEQGPGPSAAENSLTSSTLTTCSRNNAQAAFTGPPPSSAAGRHTRGQKAAFAAPPTPHRPRACGPAARRGRCDRGGGVEAPQQFGQRRYELCCGQATVCFQRSKLVEKNSRQRLAKMGAWRLRICSSTWTVRAGLRCRAAMVFRQP
jgi:hypothetical protein